MNVQTASSFYEARQNSSCLHSGWHVAVETSKGKRRSITKKQPATAPSSKRGIVRPLGDRTKDKCKHVFRSPTVDKAEREERNQDATKLYAHRYRDHGRFGSHSTHDGYGDDDRPESLRHIGGVAIDCCEPRVKVRQAARERR
jgi:hypothetical protein